MAKTNKRVSHHTQYKRDMDLIFGKKKTSSTTSVAAPTTAKVGPSEGVLDKMMNRRNKFKTAFGKE